LKIRWLKLAARDLEQIEAYIARENPAAAVGVVLRVVEAVELLAEQPGIGRPGQIEGTRELVINGTPFLVPYRQKDGYVEILRVYHHSRCWPDTL